MVDLLYRAIYWIAGIHDHIMNINNSGGWYFDDKQLHFIVIGVLGMLMIFVTYPVFKLLAETGHTMVVSWLYTFTMILVITFAIEIGQWFSGTGQMETEDIASGVAGFLVMFFIFAVIRAIFQAFLSLFRRDDSKEAQRQELREEAERSRREKTYRRPDTSAQMQQVRYAGEQKPLSKRPAKKKHKLSDIAHMAANGGLSVKNLASEGKSFLEDLAGEIAEEKIRTEEIPAPVEKIHSQQQSRPVHSDRDTLVMPVSADAAQTPVQRPVSKDTPQPAAQRPVSTDGGRETLVMSLEEIAEAGGLDLKAAEADDRMTYVMPSPEFFPEKGAASAEKAADRDVEELFAEFDRVAAEPQKE